METNLDSQACDPSDSILPNNFLAKYTNSVHWCKCYYGEKNVFMKNVLKNGELVTIGDYDGRCRGWYRAGILD
jgi:hypothetical protein